MDIKQSIRTALRSLLVNRLRFAQVALCMVVGVAGVISLLNVSQAMFALADYVYSQYNSPDTIHFAVMTNVNNPKRMNVEDMRRWAADNPDIIEAISPHLVSAINARIKFPEGVDAAETNCEKYGGYYVYGVDENYMDTMTGLSLAAGRFFKPLEVDRAQRVCVVGMSVDNDLQNQALGSTLRLWGEDYQVIGVFDLSAGDYNMSIMIPYTVMKRLQGEVTTPMQTYEGYGGEFYVDVYYMKAHGVENIANARLAAEAMLTENLGRLNRDWYYVSASYRYFEESAKTAIYSTILTYLLFVAVILLVGGVGLMNVMLAAVQERTQEIGIRKAFGAASRDIKRQFLTEAVVIGLIGGLLGCALGGLGTYIGCWLTYTPPSFVQFSVWPYGAALLVAMGLGVMFGLYPARQAAQMEPVAAINSD